MVWSVCLDLGGLCRICCATIFTFLRVKRSDIGFYVKFYCVSRAEFSHLFQASAVISQSTALFLSYEIENEWSSSPPQFGVI